MKLMAHFLIDILITVIAAAAAEFSKNDWGGTSAYKSVPRCSCSLIVIVW